MCEKGLDYLKSIGSLNGESFYIPSYQRGYRWTEQQVKDLLDDVNEFMKGIKGEFYCLQPLVVKRNDNRIDVIDGQQRLTTLHILLSFLKSETKYSLEYETRPESKDFLENIAERESKKEQYIDFHYIWKAREAIEEWFKNSHVNEKEFLKKLLNDVKFIWYETDEPDPIKVFTRLNIGKIGLTNSELIKALFLNRSNFNGSTKIRLRQQEIASQWDSIEYTLQNDEFWMFLYKPEYSTPTRIDFIFDLIHEMNLLDDSVAKEKSGNDAYKTFRYFYEHFKSHAESGDKFANDAWKNVETVFHTFEEWYNDLELYHYVGYLIACGNKLVGLLEGWAAAKNKEGFVSWLKERIREEISGCNDLDNLYEISSKTRMSSGPKKHCKPLLLLHNIQTAINQGKVAEKSYGTKMFYKFPFNLYKVESWDVEHIDSNTENPLSDKAEQNEYLRNCYLAVGEELQREIIAFVDNDNSTKFDSLRKKVDEELHLSDGNALSQEEKNQIWNFTLLDANTNRSYGNSIFPAKRRVVIGKDKGKMIGIPRLTTRDRKTCFMLQNDEDASSSFIPPCTKQVFLKYYNPLSTNPNHWDKEDAKAYKKDIAETLKEFGVAYSEED